MELKWTGRLFNMHTYKYMFQPVTTPQSIGNYALDRNEMGEVTMAK